MADRTMDSYAPFDSGAGADVTEVTWRSFMKRLIRDGVIWGAANNLEAFGDSTGMQVKVKSGEAWIEGHWGSQTAQQTYAIATAHATLARIDTVIVRADFVNNRLEVGVLTGTAAGSPVPPTLTQSASIWEIALADVAVGAAVSTITAGNVTDRRTFTGSAAQTGIVGRSQRTTNINTTGSIIRMLSVRAPVLAGRSYRVSSMLEIDAATTEAVSQPELRYTTDDTEPTTTSTILQRTVINHQENAIPDGAFIEGIFFAAASGYLRVVLCMSRVAGTGTITLNADATFPTTITVEDLGPTVLSSGTIY